MKTLKTDVAIIGAGTAGLNARREAEKAGLSWLLIEDGPYGTTCARVGCMPSKLLIAAADAVHEVAHAAPFGVRVDGWSVDGRAVMQRVRSERDRFVGFVVEATEALPDDRRIRGRARFVASNRLRVGEHTEIEAKSVVVATGSSPWIPPSLDAVRDRVLVNDDVFSWQDLPESVAVIGAGTIGLELGQALHRLGVRTTVFNLSPRAGLFSDPELQAEALRVFAAELDLQVGVRLHDVTPQGEGVLVRWTTSAGEERSGAYATVLAAAGRRPNVQGMGFEDLGVVLGPRGVPVTDPRTLQVGDLPVFLAGDVAGHRPVLHEAADEGRIAGSNAAHWPAVTASIRRTHLAIAFTDPQMALVGQRWDELDPAMIEVGEVSYNDQGRARVMGKNRGLVRVYADRSSSRLVGAEMLGPRVEHTAHLLAWTVQQGLTVQQALKMPVYHPVVEEGIRTALRDAAKKLRITGACPPEDFAEAVGQ